MPTKLKALTCAAAVLFVASVLVLALPQRAAAQDGDDPPGRVARLSYMQGSVSFQPAGESDWVLATLNRPLTTGDKLWIDDGSRAELHIGAAAIRLGSMTGFSFLNLDDRTVQIQLSAGTVYIRVRHLDRDDNFEVDTPNQAFSITRAGRYRVDASEDGNSTWVAVYDGEGESSGADRTYTVESGQLATLTGTDSLDADINKISERDHDDFDQWCEVRDRRDERSRSARYVSPELVGYEDLDDNGAWRHDSEYGDIWVPTRVSADWAPYRYGHWSWISPWGWTWVDDAAWGYAPFHYGRWVYTRSAWAWVPGPLGVAPVYAPALVAFVGTPHFSVAIGIGQTAAVGWFPLGPREVYVPSYQVSREYVNRVNVSNTTVNSAVVTNVYNTTVINNVNNTRVTQINYVNRSAPGGVTAVPEGTFRGSQPVGRAAVTVNERELRGSPVIMRAEVAPTRNSVLGDSENRGRRPAMPPGLIERQVVARRTPPPPPVSFERQASALAAHPGRPLAHNEVETLRPVNAESAHPMIRQAPARQSEIPDRNRPDTSRADKDRFDKDRLDKDRGGKDRADKDRTVGEPAANNGRPSGQPGNGRSEGFGNRKPNSTPAEVTPANLPRNDRPASAQPENRGRFGNRPDAQPGYQPTKGQPGYAQPAKEPTEPVNPAAAPADTPRNDRPASAQPENRGRFGNRPDAQPNYRPGNGRPRDQQPNTPAQSVNPAASPLNVPSRNDQPAPTQPENRGRFGNRPDAQPNYRPGNGQPRDQQPNAPAQSVNPAAPPLNTPSRNDQPASAQPENRGRFGNRPDAQPNYRPGNAQPRDQQPNPPAQPEYRPLSNRPSPSAPPREVPSAPQAPNTIANRPVNTPAASAPAPAPEPRRAAPSPPPPPPPAAAPRPAPPAAAPPAPAHNQSPAAARASNPSPAAQGGNAHGNGNKDKDDKRKN